MKGVPEGIVFHWKGGDPTGDSDDKIQKEQKSFHD